MPKPLASAPALLAAAGFSCVAPAHAAPIAPESDVTATLGPAFFFDDAAAGGQDVNLQEPGGGTFVRDFGPLSAGAAGSTLTIRGLGWAAPRPANANDADSVTAVVTWLGGDGVEGGGDDVVLGSRTDAYPQPHPGPGEVAWLFDTAIVATIDGSQSVFSVALNPWNAAGNGTLTLKASGGSAFENVKLSVAGGSVAVVPEPASAAGLAAGGLLLLKRRR